MILPTVRSIFVGGFLFVVACAFAQSGPQTAPRATNQSATTEDARRDAALEAIASQLAAIRDETAEIKENTTRHETDYWPPVWSNWVLILVSAGAVVAAFITLGTLEKQVTSGQATADIAKETMLLTHRPHLVVRNVVVDGFDQGTLGDSLTNCRVLIANTGTTKATLIKGHAEWLFAKHLPMENPVSKVHHPDQDPVVMEAGAIRTINMGNFDFGFDGHMTIFGEGEPNPRAPKIFVVGYVKYRDDLGILRRTYFGRMFDRVKRRFVPVDHPAYEYAD